MRKLLLIVAVLPMISFANEVPLECLPPSLDRVETYIFPNLNQEMDIMMETAECARVGNRTLDCLHSFKLATEFCGESNVANYTKVYVEHAKKALDRSSDVKAFNDLINSVE